MASERVLHVTEAGFDAEVLGSKELVLVDFWASWCGPCRMIAPVLDELAEEYAGRVKICKVNVDEEPALAQRYKIMSIPAVFLFRGGEVVEKMVGARPKQAFADAIEENL
ncbi:thioredoxin [bacterium]|nr:thioredoxin [bacterium]MDD5919119.1 thioredoxin [bacterium]MDD6046972.1 thioredoxin [bacterium]